MPQESRLTPTRPPTNRISQLTRDDLIHLRNAHLEPSSNPYTSRPYIGSRNKEHMNRGAERETGLQTEQVLAFGMAEEGAVTTVKKARYDEGSDASFRRLVKGGRSGEPATSSMEVSGPYYHGIDDRMSTGHTSTVTPSNQKPHSHGRCTDESRTAEHTSTVTDTTDGTSQTDIEGEDDEIVEDGIDQLPPQVDNTLLHILELPTPPNIIQLAYSMADRTDVTVTEEEHRSFQRQPLEAQRHAVRVFFKELVYSGFSLQE